MADDETRYDEEHNFHKTFYMMADRVEKLFSKLENLEMQRGKLQKEKVQYMEVMEEIHLLLLLQVKFILLLTIIIIEIPKMHLGNLFFS